MIDFSTLQGLTIPEGVVTQIADASGRVLWKQAPSEATVTITGNGYSSATATINGVTYNTATTLVVPIGTVITCFANYEYRNYIWVNGEDAEGTVDDYGYSLEEDLYYDYTVCVCQYKSAEKGPQKIHRPVSTARASGEAPTLYF